MSKELETKRIAVFQNGKTKEITKEDGKYYYLGKLQIRKLSKEIVEIREETAEKDAKKRPAKKKDVEKEQKQAEETAVKESEIEEIKIDAEFDEGFEKIPDVSDLI